MVRMKILRALNRQIIKEKLAKHFPVSSVDHVMHMVDQHRFHLTISRRRASKLGDFRPPYQGKPARITVNGDLNVYACLLIFLHELAHLLVWESAGHQPNPHGKAWKQIFGHLLRESVQQGYFHPSLHEAIITYSYNVKATGLADEVLFKELRRFDNENDHDELLLEELPERAHFTNLTGHVFRKETLMRKRYKCYCLTNKRYYLFSPLARVKKMHQEAAKEVANEI